MDVAKQHARLHMRLRDSAAPHGRRCAGMCGQHARPVNLGGSWTVGPRDEGRKVTPDMH
jgi:hypothetical protein